MKDNFDLKNYLVENKMTENSRGEGRHHFGETFISPKVLTENYDPYDHHDPDYGEDYASKEGADALDRYNDALRDDALNESPASAIPSNPRDRFEDMLTYLNSWGEFGDGGINLNLAGHDIQVDDENTYIDGKPCEEWSKNDPIFNDLMLALKNDPDFDAESYNEDREDLSECGDVPTDFSGTVEEAGYTDDEDEWDDTDMSLANILRTDKKAAQAQKAAARDIEPVDDSDLDAPVNDDEPVDEPDEAPAPKSSNKWVTGDLTMDSLFGADAPNVDILVGDEDLSNDEALKQLFQKNKNYRPALLKRAVSQAMDYFREYEKPDVLYLMPAIDRGGYEMSRFNAGRRAVAAVYRPEDLTGQNWADQI